MHDLQVENKDGILTLRVRAKPRSSRSRVLGVRAGALEVSLAAPPVHGQANAELVRTLATHFRLAKSSVSIVSGTASKTKLVSLRDITPQEFYRRLQSGATRQTRPGG